MAAPFPTALQRTSDERWVTLDLVAREEHRALARILEEPQQAAVVRLDHGQPYDRHLRRLLATPPPEPGAGVHVAWPVDLLHDLDARAVGYAAPRPGPGTTVPLADFVDPARRAEIAPLATRRHLLRVARNTATATAALHHSGHGRIRGRQFRLDDRARVVVVRVDELVGEASPTVLADDRRRFGWLVVRLLGGRPWASDGHLADLIRRVHDPSAAAAPAEEWFFALRVAERALPAAPATPTVIGSAETRVVVGTDLASALHDAREGASADPVPVDPVRAAPVPAAPAPAEATLVDRVPAERAAARTAFAAAAGLAFGGMASIAPFATFLAIAVIMVLRAAIDVGRRKTTLGPHQTVAITLSRLVPFATGGLALAAFILLDLLLLLGLCMAIAERAFGYGPGFTLTWILQLPEVPGLVRAFSFAVGAAGGLSLGGRSYDRIRAGAGDRRLIATPAFAVALALGILALDAAVVWWPLPLVA